jgi:hypothetical protein
MTLPLKHALYLNVADQVDWAPVTSDLAQNKPISLARTATMGRHDNTVSLNQ